MKRIKNFCRRQMKQKPEGKEITGEKKQPR